ncbi:hypothetical protein E4U10_005353 [Claviceps purpurea]|nr:hypothetical protein E4U10_005353 [Claviceps purpurea]
MNSNPTPTLTDSSAAEQSDFFAAVQGDRSHGTTLRGENTILRGENTTLRGENTILRDELTALRRDVSRMEQAMSRFQGVAGFLEFRDLAYARRAPLEVASSFSVAVSLLAASYEAGGSLRIGWLPRRHQLIRVGYSFGVRQDIRDHSGHLVCESQEMGQGAGVGGTGA